MKKKIGEEKQTVCENMVAEILEDKYGNKEIGEYICKKHNCNPLCHRQLDDPFFIEMEKCEYWK